MNLAIRPTDYLNSLAEIARIIFAINVFTTFFLLAPDLYPFLFQIETWILLVKLLLRFSWILLIVLTILSSISMVVLAFNADLQTEDWLARIIIVCSGLGILAVVIATLFFFTQCGLQ
jgi:hypothetical protein